MIRRLAGVVLRPRSTMAELVQRPVWVGAWLSIVIVTALCGVALLSTEVGRQALVDERVRAIEAFGGTVDDPAYEALEARPPWWVYLTSGSRVLLTPASTLLMAAACWLAARVYRPSARFEQALAIVVHASVILVIGQLVATPVHYVHESLTSPLNLAAILPGMEQGSLASRVLGTLDLVALWWLLVIATGLSALTGRASRVFFGWFGLVYLGFAAVMAGVIAAVGGN